MNQKVLRIQLYNTSKSHVRSSRPSMMQIWSWVCPCRINSEFWWMLFGRKGHRSGETIGSWIMTMHLVTPPLQCNSFWCRNQFKLSPSHCFLQISLHASSGSSQDSRLGWQVIFLWSNQTESNSRSYSQDCADRSLFCLSWRKSTENSSISHKHPKRELPLVIPAMAVPWE